MDEFSNSCKICDLESEDPENDNWVIGFIGIIPVTFCENCYNGLAEMVNVLEAEFPDDEIE